MPNQDILRKFDTEANLLLPGALIINQWGYATDTKKIVIRKPDGTYALIGNVVTS